MAKYKVVFFDLDGTLWDPVGCLNHVMEIVMPKLMASLRTEDAVDLTLKFNCAFLSLVEEHGVSDTSAFSRHERFGKLFEFFDVGKRELAQKISYTYDSARRLAMRWFIRPGALEVLRELRRRGVRCGVITNGTPPAQRHAIQGLGLKPYLDYEVLGEIEGYCKPDVHLFRRALEMADAAPEQALHVGDNLFTDVLGASRAGIPTVWLKPEGRQHQQGLPLPDYVIEELPELLPIALD